MTITRQQVIDAAKRWQISYGAHLGRKVSWAEADLFAATLSAFTTAEVTNKQASDLLNHVGDWLDLREEANSEWAAMEENTGAYRRQAREALRSAEIVAWAVADGGGQE